MASRREHRDENRQRNRRLLAGLIRRQGKALLGVARNHSEWPDNDAEEALSQAELQFLCFFDGGGEEEARRWMLLVVKRCAWALRRQRRERRAIVEEVSLEQAEAELGFAPLDRRRDPAERAEAAEEVARFAAALASLKAEERRAIVLVALGYSRAEVRELLAWSPAKLHRSLVNGRAALRRLLREGGDGS